ncbi:MAG: TolC family protein, partial [Chthoniobacterales bacterium]|nr:TolC family protein [Chthoniobacterales bacterium]
MRKFFINIFSILLLAIVPTVSFAGSDTVAGHGVPRFTLEQAILAALQRNPDIQRARQEIERTKGVYLELRADALPRVDATGNFTDTDPHLNNFTGDGGTP